MQGAGGAPVVVRRSGGETTSRLLEELCCQGALARVRDGERRLKEYVDAEARELPPEAFGKLMAELHHRITYMMRRCGVCGRVCRAADVCLRACVRALWPRRAIAHTAHVQCGRVATAVPWPCLTARCWRAPALPRLPLTPTHTHTHPPTHQHTRTHAHAHTRTLSQP
jgi:hypothetical protein